MSSAAKLAANRANAQHSTGPNDTSKTRLNGLRHGMTGKTTVLPGENQEEFDQFRGGFLADLKPSSELENLLAERVIAAAWRLKRFASIETAFYTNRIEAFLETNPDSDPDMAMANLFIDPEETKKMRLFMRYQKATEREYDKAMTEFRKAREERAQEAYEKAITLGDETDENEDTQDGFASYAGEQSLSSGQTSEIPTANRTRGHFVRSAGTAPMGLQA